MNRTLKIALPLLVVAVAIVAAVVLVRSRPAPETQEPAPRVPVVQVLTVAPRPVRLDVESQGTVAARTEATLAAQVGGRIVEVAPSFAEGGLFRAGQTLVRIDSRDYRLAVERAQAQVAQAEVRLARENAEAEVARAEWGDLEAAGAVSGTPGALVLRAPQLAEARAAVAAAEAQVSQARLDLERTTVTAPFNGRVRRKMADVGQSVAPGAPLAEVYAIDYAEVSLPVPVSELGYLDLSARGAGGSRGAGAGGASAGGGGWAAELRNGPTVRLTAELGGSRHVWTGRVVRTAGAIDPETRMLPLIARVDDPYGRAAREAGAPLALGLFVTAEIAGREVEGVYVLPRSALRQTGRWREGEPGRVLVVEAADGGADDDPSLVRLRFRDVQILRLAGDDALISAGLAPGDRVVTSPLETPTDGMAARVAEEKPAPPTGSAGSAGTEPGRFTRHIQIEAARLRPGRTRTDLTADHPTAPTPAPAP